MLSNRETDVSQDIFEAEMKIVKIKVLLNDLLNDYNFDKEPDLKTIQNLAYDAKRVISFIKIINDYVFDTEKELEKAQSRLNNEGEAK